VIVGQRFPVESVWPVVLGWIARRKEFASRPALLRQAVVDHLALPAGGFSMTGDLAIQRVD
jgi:hypothetical protein